MVEDMLELTKISTMTTTRNGESISNEISVHALLEKIKHLSGSLDVHVRAYM